MACMCHTGTRRLLLFAPDLATAYPELMEFQPGDASWQVMPELDAVRVDIGPKHAWQTTRELVNVLRTMLDPARLERMTAAWAHHCTELTTQLPELVGAQPVTSMAPLDAGPLSDVLQNRRIETWYQPVVTAGDHAIWGYECLMRGRYGDGTLIRPKQILDWARQEQLTFMLDRICRETHLLSAGQANLPGHARVLINFLPTTVYDPNYCLRTTVQAAKQVELEPSRIIFEVVESEKVDDREHLLSILGYYRHAGFSVALDDVGTGYSGLMMLAELNPDLIKIDRAMVSRAPESKLHEGICRSLVELARESGKLALAEGVETRRELALMEGLGVDLVQGYYFGEPSPEPRQDVDGVMQPVES